VAELFRNLANNTPWFTKPELVEIVAGNVTLSGKEQKRVANFVIKVKLVRASEVEKAAVSPAVSSSAPLPVADQKKQ
jgi:type IV pilus assembly protein PilN